MMEGEALCSQAGKQRETIHGADAMTIAEVKIPKFLQQHVHVYRGDCVKDQDGLPAVFRELRSWPTNIQAVNLTLFLGLVEGFVIQTADAARRFFKRPLSSSTPHR